MTDLADLVDRLGDAWDHDGDRVSIADELARAFHILTAQFDDLAVVRGGRLQVVLQRGPGGARLLLAESASAADREALAAGLRRGDALLATASELLALALALPTTRPRRLGPLLRRIAELGRQLAAA
jgi:hypothetical protein